MKKLIYLLFFVSIYSFGQTYYGYKNRSYGNEDNTYKREINCDDAIKLVEQKGSFLDSSYGGYNEDAIDKIRWYNYKDTLYCIVYFKTNTYKGYIYGGWKYNFDLYYELKKGFENATSKGKFFWEYIERAKINCN